METTQVTDEQIREIGRKIGEQPGVVQVWLFGSHATGNAGPDSDGDLPAVYEERPNILARMSELDDLFPPPSLRDGHSCDGARVVRGLTGCSRRPRIRRQ